MQAKRILSLFLSALTAFTAFSLWVGCNKETEKEEPNVGDPTVQAVTPAIGEKVSLVNEYIYKFSTTYVLGESEGISGQYVTYTDNFAPVGVELSWTAEGDPTGYELLLSTDKKFTSPTTYTLTENSVCLEDLFVNYTYYWKVTAKYEAEEDRTSKYFTFTTENTPRTISIEGVSNTRDIGGKKAAGGKLVKQGVAYRGAHLDEVTSMGSRMAKEKYGIKTDLDLREANINITGNSSPLKGDVRYVNYSCPYYWGGTDGIDSPLYRKNLAGAIRVFANADNYPIFFHCSLGRDRTSMISMLLLGLLGVSKTDIYIDYEMSAFSYRGTMNGSSMTNLILAFENTYNGIMQTTGKKTFQEACEAFLLDIHITPQEIAAIRSNLLED